MYLSERYRISSPHGKCWSLKSDSTSADAQTPSCSLAYSDTYKDRTPRHSPSLRFPPGPWLGAGHSLRTSGLCCICASCRFTWASSSSCLLLSSHALASVRRSRISCSALSATAWSSAVGKPFCQGERQSFVVMPSAACGAESYLTRTNVFLELQLLY